MSTGGKRDFACFSHIGVIEFEEQWGKQIQVENVALFNTNKISPEDAIRLIRSGEYSEYVLCMPKKQWISLFRDGREE